MHERANLQELCGLDFSGSGSYPGDGYSEHLYKPHISTKVWRMMPWLRPLALSLSQDKCF